MNDIPEIEPTAYEIRDNKEKLVTEPQGTTGKEICWVNPVQTLVGMIVDQPPDLQPLIILGAMEAVSSEQRLDLFVALMNYFPRKIQEKLFRGWLQISKDVNLLERVAAEAAFAVRTEGYTKEDSTGIEDYFEMRFDADPSISPKEMVREYVKFHPYWRTHRSKLLSIAQKVKKRVAEKLRARFKKQGKKFCVKDASNITRPERRPKRRKKEYVSQVPFLSEDIDTNTLTVQRLSFSDPYALIKECEKQLRGLGVYEVAIELADLLLKNRDCSSLVPITQKHVDSETRYVCQDKRLYSVLSRITLVEHAVRLARFVVDDRRPDDINGNLIGAGLVTALACEIGKVPEVAVMGLSPEVLDHGFIAAGYLASRLSSIDKGWVKDAQDALREHHLARRKTVLGELLYRAEAIVRSEEISAALFGDDHRALPWKAWFRPEEFIDLIKPHVNVSKYGHFSALLWDTNLYCDINFIFDAAKKYAADMGVIDYRFARPTDRTELLKTVVDSLWQAGFADNSPRYYRHYDIQYVENYSARILTRPLIPVKHNWGSETMFEMDGRRKEHLKYIKSITPGNPFY